MNRTGYQKMLEYEVSKFNEIEFKPLDHHLDFFRKQWDKILTDDNTIDKIKEEADRKRKEDERIIERLREAMKATEEKLTKEKEKKHIIERLSIQYCFFTHTISSLMTISFCNPSESISNKLLLFDKTSKKLIDYIIKKAYENNITKSDIEKEIKRINSKLSSDEIRTIFLNHFIGIKAMSIFNKNPDMFKVAYDTPKPIEYYTQNQSSINDFIEKMGEMKIQRDNSYYNFDEQQSIYTKFKNTRYSQPQYKANQIQLDFQLDKDENLQSNYLKQWLSRLGKIQ